MIKAQSPERIRWEEAALLAMVASGFSRSDAQSTVETTKGEALLDSLYQSGIEPALAAQKLID